MKRLIKKKCSFVITLLNLTDYFHIMRIKFSIFSKWIIEKDTGKIKNIKIYRTVGITNIGINIWKIIEQSRHYLGTRTRLVPGIVCS